MRAPGRLRLCALIVLVVGTVLAPRSHAEHLTITSVPACAAFEIDGAAIGVTPYTVDYPSSYFHKPHTVFSSRLEHALILKIHKERCAPQQITLTDGPLQWTSETGRRHGSGASSEPSGALMKASLEAAHTATSTVSFSSQPNGAEIYIDGKFVG